jgi:hypothetical protein
MKKQTLKTAWESLSSGAKTFPVCRGSEDRLKRFTCILVLAFFVTSAWGHDPYEISTKLYLRTNSLELRVTVAAKTMVTLMAADGDRSVALTSPADVEGARPSLAKCAANLFQITAADQVLIAASTNVALGVEDHMELVLTYPRPAPGTLRVNAIHLKKLPEGDPYGAAVTVVDLANNVALGQQLLTRSEPVFEARVSGVPTTASSSTHPVGSTTP